jgi:CSLREA domain-containing protein
MVWLSLPASASAITINVTRFDDVTANDATCSLREAIISAQANAGNTNDCTDGMGADLIQLQAGTYTLAGTGEDANVLGDLDVTDPGEGITIDGAVAAGDIPQTTIQAPPMDRHFQFHDPGADPNSVTLQELILQGGNPQTGDGGAILVDDDEAQFTLDTVIVRMNTAPGGGGLSFPSGSDQGPSLQIEQSEFSNNTTGGDGGGLYYSVDDGVADDFAMRIERSTFVANSATGTGGGVFVDGTNSNDTLNVFNSTFSGNSATGGGGGIGVGGSAARANFRFATIAGNTTPTAGQAGGVQTSSNNHDIHFTGTILSGNAPVNCAEVAPGDMAFVATTDGYNLESANTCGLSPLANDLLNTDPLLAPLATNAGPDQTTRTHGLYDTSPALNRIPRAPDLWCTIGNTNGIDQRGVARPGAPAGLCDVGAFEGSVGPVPTTPAVTPPATTPLTTPTTTPPKKKKCKKKKKKGTAAAKKCKKKKR